MDTHDIIALGGIALTAIGMAITLGRFYQRLNDAVVKVNDQDRALTAAMATSVADGNRITRLEAQYTQIIGTLAEIKADVRIVIKGQ